MSVTKIVESSTPCYVFNPGLHDLTLEFGGRWFLLPKGEVTKVYDLFIQAPNEYMRNISAMGNGEVDDPNAMYRQTIKAKDLVGTLMNRHQVNLYDCGFVVSDEPITETQKERAVMKARQWGAKIVAEFLQEKRERAAGGYGRLYPSDQELDWMQFLGIHDEIVNPQQPQPGIDQKSLEAIGATISAAVVGALREGSTEKRK